MISKFYIVDNKDRFVSKREEVVLKLEDDFINERDWAITENTPSNAKSFETLEAAKSWAKVYLTEAQRKHHMFRVKQFNFKYANQHLYTDIEPWEVVNVISAKTIEIRKMKAVEADWGREFVAGGFFGHTPNNQDQKWLIGSDETQPVIRARLNKKGFYKSEHGSRHYLADQPIKFYDYNF